MTVVKKKSSKKLKAKKTKTPPEARTVGEHELTILPDEPPVSASDGEAFDTGFDPSIVPELPPLAVPCRYCGEPAPISAPGTPYVPLCGKPECHTGDPKVNELGHRLA